ncbi:MAG: outer membrane protein assembly factor BamE [Bdellovibrionales bacterium]
MFSRFSSILLTLLFCLSMSACAPKVATRGAVLDPEEVAKIEVGTSSRENVLDTLGSPTQVSTFDETIWYYITRKTEQRSFLDPQTIEQKSIEIKFDDNGIVEAMNEFDAKDAETITPVSRRTPTYGRQTSFIEQLMGNVGRPGSLSRKQ